jgi:8-oxo-dGTP pyrophosphatase MutT (NUDIX family)
VLDADALLDALQRHELFDVPDFPGRHDDVGAGVLVPVLLDEGATALTLRPASMRRHAGEVSFPGGLPEPGDGGVVGTALREAREEIGLTEARVLGRLSTFPLYTSAHRLHPFLAVSRQRELVPQPEEVERILRPRFADLLALPEIPAIAFDWEGQQILSPVWEIEDALVFGATAHVLLEAVTVVAAALGEGVPPRTTGKYRWGRQRPELA